MTKPKKHATRGVYTGDHRPYWTPWGDSATPWHDTQNKSELEQQLANKPS